MDRFGFELCRIVSEFLEFPEPIVEIASRIIPGQEAVSDLRRIFRDQTFIGCDLETGNGVDRVEDIERMSFRDNEVGSLVSLNTLEHVFDVFSAAREIERVLRPGGTLLVSSVFNFHIHSYPNDYWRFTPQVWRKLFPRCRYLITGQQGYRTTPRITFCLGILGDELGIGAAELGRLQQRLERVHERRRAIEWIRIRMGYYLLKKRAFRDFVHAGEVRLRLYDQEKLISEVGFDR